MQKSQLLELLSKLDKTDLTRFKKYLESPYLNNSKNAVILFDFLRKYLQTQKGKSFIFPTQKVYQKIFDQKFDDTTKQNDKLNHLKSTFYKLLFDFLATEQRQAQEEKGKDKSQLFFLLEAYFEKNLGKQFYHLIQKEIDQHKLSSNNNTLQDINYFYNLFQLSEYYYQSQIFHSSEKDRQTYLQNTIDNLDYYYITNKLRLYLAVLSQTNNFSTPFNFIMLEETLQTIKTHQLTRIPLIAAYYYLTIITIDNKQLYESAEETTNKLKQLLFQQAKAFNQFDLRQLYTGFINVLFRRVSQNERLYYQELYEIYTTALPQKVFHVSINEKKYLPFAHLLKSVKAGIAIGNIASVEEIVETYYEEIHPQFAQNDFYYLKALVLTAQKKYEQAQETLQIVQTKNIYIQFFCRQLRLQIYYLTALPKEQETYVLNQFTNDLRWIKNHGSSSITTEKSKAKPFFPPQKEQTYKQFISHLKNAYLLKTDFLKSPQEIQTALTELKSNIIPSEVYDSYWLLQNL